ncbi:AMP-binding protein, partial [Bacillus sp. S34]|nr:AMP-binding protein [Bacillus sp. S34]
KLFDKLVYGKLRDAIGGRVQYAISGSAPLSPRLSHFFRSIGVLILEGYGLTETTAPATVNRAGELRRIAHGRYVPVEAWDGGSCCLPPPESGAEQHGAHRAGSALGELVEHRERFDNVPDTDPAIAANREWALDVLRRVPRSQLGAHLVQDGDVTFTPPVSGPAAGALERLGMGVYDKVFLRFPEVFWGGDWVVRQQGPAGVDWHSWYDMSRVTGEPVLAALVGSPQQVVDKIAEMPEPDRGLAERIHRIALETAPEAKTVFDTALGLEGLKRQWG